MKRLGPKKGTILMGTLALLVLCGGNSAHGVSIQLSVAMPVTNQSLTITVPGLGSGGLVNVADSHGVSTQLLVNAQSQAAWTPTRYGKYIVSSGPATQTLWATSRPMTFHWWDCTTAQTNVTVVMQRDSAWQARGVTRVDWTGGEAYSRGVDGHYWTNAVEWSNGWSYAYSTGGMAIDEAYCDAGIPTDPILQAIAMVRQAQGKNYNISLWSAGFGLNFAAGAALLKSNNVTVLIEDYYGTWNLHSSRWAAVRSYGLQNQAISGIWPGIAPLTNEAAVRADMALVRLVAPEANGIAIFAPVTNSFSPPVQSSVLNACDQAIEDYFLKPLIHLTVNASAQLVVWNLGNDDATGFSLDFLNGSRGVVQTADLSRLTANGKWLLAIPGGAVNARVGNPAGTANLYTGHSQYSNGLFPLAVPGRYTWNNANGNALWSTSANWNPSGPPPGNIDSGNCAYFDGAAVTPHSLTAAAGEISINSVQFVTGGWTLAGNATSQDFYTYGISSAGAGTNTINIGISARDVVPASFSTEAGNTLVLNGLVGAARNNGGLVKNGAGTLVLTYANTYTGGTTLNAGTLIAEPGALPGKVSNSGTLQLGRLTAAPLSSSLRISGPGLTIVTDGNSGYIQLSAANQFSAAGDLIVTNVNVNQLGRDQAVGGLGGNGFWYNNGAVCTLSLGNNGHSSAFSGAITDASAASAISVVKTGGGVQTLAGNNGYHGATTVSQGALLVSGSLGSGSAVMVNRNGVLGGTGVIHGTVTVNDGGTLTVGTETGGNAVMGMLTLDNPPILSVGSTNCLRITKTGGTLGSDRINAGSGVLNYAGTLVVANITTDTQQLAAGDTFKLFSAGGYGGGFAASNLPPLSPGLIWNTTHLVNDGTIAVGLVPGTHDALASLVIAPAGALSPGFAPGTTNYTAVNPFANNPVSVTATSADPNATLALSFNNGAFVALTNGVASGPQTLNLNPPLNTVAVRVTAQDRGPARTYTVAVTLQPSPTAPILAYGVSGNSLTLAWPADHRGCRLVVQTNNLATGISSNPNDWMTVPGTTTNIEETLPVNKLIESTFYRLVYR